MTRTICRFLLGFVLAFSAVGCATGTGDADDGDTSTSPQGSENVSDGTVEAVRQVLDEQMAAWNRGSIREFMDGYANTDTLRFASGGQIQRGWNTVLTRYQDSYADEELMGRFEFSNLEIWPLSDRFAIAFGRWDLTRSERYTSIGGLFTLVFENSRNGWEIVHDHTSARQVLQSEEDSVNADP